MLLLCSPNSHSLNGTNIYKPSTSSRLASSYSPRDDTNGRVSTTTSTGMGRDDGPQAQPLERHSLLPASLMLSSSRPLDIMSGRASLSDELASLLSPLMDVVPTPNTRSSNQAAASLSPGAALSRSNRTLATVSESIVNPPRPDTRETATASGRGTETEKGSETGNGNGNTSANGIERGNGHGYLREIGQRAGSVTPAKCRPWKPRITTRLIHYHVPHIFPTTRVTRTPYDMTD